MTLLSVDCVSKSYKDKTETQSVLSKISFDLDAGQFCTLFGPSGAGKTTLLNIVGGLDVPGEGRVNFHDLRIDALDERSKAKLRASKIGIAFQNPNLVAHLNVLENVMLPSFFGIGDNRKERALALLHRLNLGEKIRKVPVKLSDGEKRRVSIARALLTEPELILADEPTINLDSQNRDCVLDLIRESTQKGAAAIVATHDEDVSRLSDFVLRIKFGKLA
jgi:ABC-type lipoprotein export system ATPase subunit